MKSGLGGREMGKEINTKFLDEVVTSSVCIVYCLTLPYFVVEKVYLLIFKFLFYKDFQILKYKRNMSSISLLF